MLTWKFDFAEFKIDEYYADHLIPEAIRCDQLRDLQLEIQQLA